jgi:DNA-binding MarR family transcriptional regulator
MIDSPDQHSLILDIEASWRRERPDLELSNFLLAIYLTRLGRIVDDAADRLFRKRFGISGADMRVLFALRRAGKPFMRRPTDLFRALLVTSGAITKQVDRLSKKGLVERISRENQLGGVQLTAKGLKMADAATDLIAKQSIIEPGVKGLPKSERSTGQKFVQYILLGLEAAARAASEGGAVDPTPRRARRVS